jgi:hypothetical protein
VLAEACHASLLPPPPLLQPHLPPQVSTVRSSLVASLGAQLEPATMALRLDSTNAVAGLRAFHYQPEAQGFAITVVQPMVGGDGDGDGDDDDGSKLESRRAMHERLDYPTTLPLFRSVCALNVAPMVCSRLRDVHVGLPSPRVAGGVQSLVAGHYEYYHYMQDRFDDAGWGCAYRSLQTLCSWFRLQHYVLRQPPDHGEIQQTLVDLGDKPSKFIGELECPGACTTPPTRAPLTASTVRAGRLKAMDWCE